MIYFLTITVLCYLVGALNPAIILSKKILGTDIRELGSGNAGTTNIYRVMGLPMAVLVFILDLAKVVVAYALSILLCTIFKQDVTETLKYFAVAVVIGHCYPIYYGLKGGKGVATTIMIMLLLDYKIAGICITAGAVVLAVTGMVSAASLSGVILLVILTLFLNIEYFIPTAIIAALILFKHRANVKRIFNGEESKIFGKNK